MSAVPTPRTSVSSKTLEKLLGGGSAGNSETQVDAAPATARPRRKRTLIIASAVAATVVVLVLVIVLPVYFTVVKKDSKGSDSGASNPYSPDGSTVRNTCWSAFQECVLTRLL